MPRSCEWLKGAPRFLLEFGVELLPSEYQMQLLASFFSIYTSA